MFYYSRFNLNISKENQQNLFKLSNQIRNKYYQIILTRQWVNQGQQSLQAKEIFLLKLFFSPKSAVSGHCSTSDLVQELLGNIILPDQCETGENRHFIRKRFWQEIHLLSIHWLNQTVMDFFNQSIKKKK